MNKNEDGTVTALAANGHTMVYQTRPNGEPIQHSAVCAEDCRACTHGDVRPDW